MKFVKFVKSDHGTRSRKIDKQSAMVMREEGKTLRFIGEHFGVSCQAVQQMLKQRQSLPTESEG